MGRATSIMAATLCPSCTDPVQVDLDKATSCLNEQKYAVPMATITDRFLSFHSKSGFYEV